MRRHLAPGVLTLAALLTLSTAPAQAAAPASHATPPRAVQATVTLKSLTCYENADAAGGDELYLKLNGQTVWSSSAPISCDSSGPRTMPINRLARTGDAVSLYDEDFPDADDHLGSDTIEGGNGTLIFNLDDALYSLDYAPA
ncbi:hypothetical protein ACIBKY_54570 [Nonomuraea sp. NPDC050394]|uniref:hypothetical protein n=1 Tax=Nonomuraea sp. NPDC050394 TaxID=3364363 RepID=UPI0037ADFD52